MSVADALKNKVILTRASVQTDSLTVALDLTAASEAVERLCLGIFGVTGETGQDLLPQPLPEFIDRCRNAYHVLAQVDESDALHFATVMSAFVHECRHVHDLRSTRIGAELLLEDLPTYAHLPLLIDDLVQWRSSNRELSLPLPLELRDFDALDIPSRGRHIFAKAMEVRSRIDKRWRSRSCFRSIPGISVKDLFEVLGFQNQVDFLAGTYGSEVAGIVTEVCLGGAQQTRAKYLRPLESLSAWCAALGVRFDPGAGDLSRLALAALCMCSLSDSFEGERPGERHPGAWFDRFAEIYARLGKDEGCPAIERADWPSHMVAKSVLSTDMNSLYQQSLDALDQAQEVVLKGLISVDNPRYFSPAFLLATEIEIDFQQDLITRCERPDYHTPFGYLALLLEGELTRVYVRANTRSFGIVDFRMPSEIPSNHVGGARVASSASQQLRLLMTGRSIDGGFLQEEAFRHLTDSAGPNLSFRIRRSLRNSAG